jgi:AraC-like DNA-binding protein
MDEIKRIREGFEKQRLVVLPRDTVVSRCTELPIVKELYVTNIGHFPPARYHYVDRPDGCEENILIFCVGGNGWCQLLDKVWQIHEGITLIIPAGIPHCYGADEVAPWSIYWSHFRGQSASDYLNYLGVSKESPLLNTSNMVTLTEAFEDMYVHTQHDLTDNELLSLSTSQARFLALLSVFKQAPLSSSLRVEQRIFQSIKFMKKNLNCSLTLEQLSKEANLSTSHYSSLFKQQVSNSPIAFFNNLKMQRACEIFNSGETNIAGVACELGFNDFFYFSRIFKKIVGVSPSKYMTMTVNK